MSNIPYTDKQIEVINLLRSVGDVSPDVVDEVIAMVVDHQKNQQVEKEESEISIRLRLLDEKDWRKRVQLSAMLISKGLGV